MGFAGTALLGVAVITYFSETGRVLDQPSPGANFGECSLYVKSKTLPVEVFVDGELRANLLKSNPESTIELAKGDHMLEARQGNRCFRKSFRLTSEFPTVVQIIPPQDEWPSLSFSTADEAASKPKNLVRVWQLPAVSGALVLLLAVLILCIGSAGGESDKQVEVSQTMSKTILELDLVGYGPISEMLEEGGDVSTVSQLNEQIQRFVDVGLGVVGVERKQTVVQTTGDGAILMFDKPKDANQFAWALHDEARKHNRTRSRPIGKRVFRIGIATGDLYIQSKLGGGFEIAGQVIARAVRLEAKAPPGGVLVDVETYNGLTSTQTKDYADAERVSGKRDEVFDVYRCVRDPDAKNDVLHFYELAAKRIPTVVPSRENKRDTRREILKLFEELKSWRFDDLIFLLNIPIGQRPPDTLVMDQRKKHVLRWIEEEGLLDELLYELRVLTDVES